MSLYTRVWGLSREKFAFSKDFLGNLLLESGGVTILQGLRLFVFFLLGGTAYVTLEILWRGFSHYSMFLAGGLCFLLLGRLQMLRPQLYLPLRLLLGAVVITSVELLMGLLFNRSYQVWDYRQQFMNFHGQICLKFFCLWIPISGFAMWIYEKIDMMFAFGKWCWLLPMMFPLGMMSLR